METEEIAFPGAGVHLSGAITCPDTDLGCPGVVLIGGSGPSDRHNDGYFDALRTHLASASVERYAETAARTGRSQQTCVFPGAGHRLQVTAGFAPGYLTRLSTWCQNQGTG